jgi:hypothetical protein
LASQSRRVDGVTASALRGKRGKREIRLSALTALFAQPERSAAVYNALKRPIIADRCPRTLPLEQPNRLEMSD